jgi:putative ABC transport system permease protein
VRVTMHALDTRAYATVIAGTGADPRLPRPLRDPPSGDQPVPAIVSSEVSTGGPRPIRVGDEIDLLVSGRTVPIRVADVREDFPGVDVSGPWLLVPLESLRSAIGDRTFAASVIFLRAPGADAAAVQAAMDEVLPATRVTSRQQVLDELRSGPLVRGVAIGFVLAVAIALVYAALAVTAALVLVAAVRTRETAHLRTLGVTPRGLLALSVVEHGPAVLTATVIGVALGVGVAWFIAPGLDLAGLIGSPIEVSLVVDERVVGILLAALVVVLAAAIVLSTWIGRRASLAGATRQGIE